MPRPIAMQRYVDLMRVRNLPAASILAAAGIDPARLMEPDYSIDPMQYRAVIHGMLDASGDQGIGFDVGLNSALTDLGVVGHAVLTCKTVRDTYLLWGQFGNELVGIPSRLAIVEETPATVTLEFASPDAQAPLYRYHVEEMIGLLLMVGRPMVGEPPFFVTIAFSYPAPAHEFRYHDLLKCPIRFAAARTSITIRREWFEKNLCTSDEDFNKVCLRYCEEAVHRVGDSHPMISELRNMFLRLSGPLPRLEDAAKVLKTSSRTLSRRLQEEGTNYREQLDAFRRDRACEYLKFPDMSAKEVAYRLGFSEPSAFRHAFKLWTGKTIREFRAQAGLKTSPPR